MFNFVGVKIVFDMELIINTFGVSLNRDNEGFVVTKGAERQRIPVDSISSIQISKGASITSDAIMLAIEKEIEIIFVEKSGKPVGRVWSPKYGSISTIRKGQVNFCYSHDAVIWIKEIIRQKIENQQALLLTMEAKTTQESDLIDKSVQRLEDYRSKINKLEGVSVRDIAPTLRGWEGVSSKIYFDTLNCFIPEKYRFTQRTQHPAMDVTNAMLNYGYGLLYSRIESSLIKTGIDPYVGVMHRDEHNRPVLVYDVIELYRYWVDYIVFRLLCQNVINDEFYSIKTDGSCWLEVLGRRIMIQAFNDYMDEIVQMKGVSRSRETQMTLYAQNLAQIFKNHE